MSKISLISFFLCLLFFSLKPQALTQERSVFGLDKSKFSDSEYEDYMHRIYIQNYSTPLAEEKWQEVLNQVPVDVYKLKYKDNLWDLSRQFFKNSLLWSKLWGMNSQISNPHRIYPEDIIDLTLNSLASGRTDWLSGDPLFQKKVKTLTSQEIPSSIPPLNFNVPKDAFNIGDLNLKELNKQAPLPYYLREEDLSGQGEIVSKENNSQYSFNGEDVIVRIDSFPSLGIYTVFKNLGPLKKSLFNLLNVTGYEIAVKGTIEVLGFLYNTENLYRARVMDSIGLIEKGDMILPGPPQMYNLSQKGPVGAETKGKIIGVPKKNHSQKMLGLYSFVYLNKGLAENVQVGDIYYVRTGEKREKHSSEYDKSVVGKLKIAYANSEASTAVIVAVKKPIFVGDDFSHLPDMSSDLSQSEFIEEIDEETEESIPSNEGIGSSFDSMEDEMEEMEEEDEMEELGEEDEMEEMEEEGEMEELGEEDEMEEMEEEDEMEELGEEDEMEEMEEEDEMEELEEEDELEEMEEEDEMEELEEEDEMGEMEEEDEMEELEEEDEMGEMEEEDEMEELEEEDEMGEMEEEDEMEELEEEEDEEEE